MEQQTTFTDDQLEEYLDQFDIPDLGREFIDQAMQGPSRLVQSGKNNLNASLSSQKLGHSVSGESWRGERALHITLEKSSSVFFYSNQAPPISITRTSKNGTQRNQWYYGDTLALEIDVPPTVYQLKEREECEKLVNKFPRDWIKSGTGFIFKPAQDAFAKIGFDHKVICNDEFNEVRINNLYILLQARKAPDQVTPEIEKRIESVLAEKAWISIFELFEKASLASLTVVHQLIDRGVLFASLDDEMLSEHEASIVTSSPALLAVYREEQRADRYPVTEMRPGSETSLARVPTESHAKKALENLELVRSGVKNRKVQRLNQLIKEGKEKGLSEFQSLIPRYSRSGNREQRLNDKCIKVLYKFIYKRYASEDRLSKNAAYDEYVEYARKAHPDFPPVARSTFNDYIDNADQDKIARGRGGQRAANAARPPSPVEKRVIRKTVPFQLAALDHCLAKLLCVFAVSNGIAWTERPWITALRDLASGYILAVWVSFRQPSTRSNAIVLRRCVRQHGRLPAQIITDRGSDFQSVYFHSLLAHCGVGQILRDPGNSRGGSEIERLFGRFRGDWLVHRPGNLVNYKEVRSVSGSHKPGKFAVMDLKQFLSEFLIYINWFNDTIEGAAEVSPNELLRRGLRLYPHMGPEITYNEEFEVASAVDVREYSIDPARGIHIDNVWYWNPALSELPPRRKPKVRIEPENPYKVYANVGDAWVTCLGTKAKTFETLDPVKQLSEAVRTLDCRAQRTKTKDEAVQILLDEMNFDESPISAGVPLKVGAGSPAPKPTNVVSLFDQLKSIDLHPSTTTKWEKSK